VIEDPVVLTNEREGVFVLQGLWGSECEEYGAIESVCDPIIVWRDHRG